MSILLNKDSRIVVCGITGHAGSFHARKCLEYGSKIVAGVSPNKGGTFFDEKIPVYNTVKEAKLLNDVNVALIFVPPAFAADSICECIAAEIELVICITEGIPVKDMMFVKAELKNSKTRLIGPNCPGILTPGESNASIMPAHISRKGKVGIVSKSGTLTYEAILQLTERGYGQSTCVGIGGDPIVGSSHTDIFKLFNEDPETEAIILIGEIGGKSEEMAAEYIKKHVNKPVIAFIAGTTAPQGKRMGHAGAIVAGFGDSAHDKIKKLRDCGITVANSPAQIGDLLTELYH